MNKSIKLFLILTIACLAAIMGNSVKAQEDQENQDTNPISTQTIQDNANQEIASDEQVSAQNLEVKDPKLLPDSPFYFLKNWVRNIESAFTFNKVKKAGLESKFANEKLIELHKMVKNNASPEKIAKATENYKKQIEKIKTQVDKISGTAENNIDVNKFLDRFTKQQILQEKVLQKLETQVPADVFEKIKEARENHLEKFGEIMTKLETRAPEIMIKIENAINEEGGSQFKDFKNLEILKNIGERIPEKAKEAIQQAQENSLNRIKSKLENMSPEDQNKFRDYIDKISGDKEKQAEILENIKSTTIGIPMLQQKLIEARTKIINKVELKNQEKNCLAVKKPAPDFCENGRIVPQKDDKGCIVEFRCVRIEKPEIISTCTQLWDPVCGKNSKTYSNKCFATLANIPIIYRGECKKEETTNRVELENQEIKRRLENELNSGQIGQ